MITAILQFLSPARKEVRDADQNRHEGWARSLGRADRLGQGNGGAAPEVGGAGAQGHADTELAAAAGDGVAEHAADAKGARHGFQNRSS